MLKSGDKVIHKAFELGFWGIDHSLYNRPERKLQAAFDAKHKEDLTFMAKSLQNGLERFHAVFGFPSASFIPNNYIVPGRKVVIY